MSYWLPPSLINRAYHSTILIIPAWLLEPAYTLLTASHSFGSIEAGDMLTPSVENWLSIDAIIELTHAKSSQCHPLSEPLPQLGVIWRALAADADPSLDLHAHFCPPLPKVARGFNTTTFQPHLLIPLFLTSAGMPTSAHSALHNTQNQAVGSSKRVPSSTHRHDPVPAMPPTCREATRHYSRYTPARPLAAGIDRANIIWHRVIPAARFCTSPTPNARQLPARLPFHLSSTDSTASVGPHPAREPNWLTSPLHPPSPFPSHDAVHLCRTPLSPLPPPIAPFHPLKLSLVKILHQSAFSPNHIYLRVRYRHVLSGSSRTRPLTASCSTFYTTPLHMPDSHFAVRQQLRSLRAFRPPPSRRPATVLRSWIRQTRYPLADALGQLPQGSSKSKFGPTAFFVPPIARHSSAAVVRLSATHQRIGRSRVFNPAQFISVSPHFIALLTPPHHVLYRCADTTFIFRSLENSDYLADARYGGGCASDMAVSSPFLPHYSVAFISLSSLEPLSNDNRNENFTPPSGTYNEAGPEQNYYT
ncbi:hypothetical protein C8J57DRAFT_1469083 [Mycena rebaudengoi]|nr:hypothetical protein C8J57DRAFT_1469083 [Mycena rebaudengoi]